MSKRFGKPRARPGELKAQWGQLKGERPDLCYLWGEGVASADRHLLHNILYQRGKTVDGEVAMSLIEELAVRGYDVTTIKFSVRKKEARDDDR